MDSIFEKVKEGVDIETAVEAFGVKLNRNRQGLCPFHNEKTPSFSVDREKKMFKCFGCGESGDVIDFVAKVKGIEGLEAAKLLADMYNISYETAAPKPKEPKEVIKEYLTACIADIGQTDYFKNRGLNSSTVKKFKLGFDKKRNAVVIPYSGKLEYYQTRSIAEKIFFKPKTEDAGAEPLYNKEVLGAKTKEPVFVVESPICAMSITQCGGAAVSTCGTSGWRKVIENIKNKQANSFILCFDNDEPGQKVSQTLAAELLEKDIRYIAFNIAGKCKDPNELLMANPKELEENITAAKLALRKKYATAKDSFDAVELQTEKVEPPFWVVDGVLPSGLAILCAPSKLGKSWMVLQLCLAVAEGKSFLKFRTNSCECLYYALEDGKARLQDRLRKIMKGKTAPRGVRFAIKADPLEDGLFDKITEEIRTFPDIKLVVIDTLQKVRAKVPRNESLYSNDYREMAAVKDFADKNKICILFVHHLRKMADEADIFNMISGSTALMGAADTIFVISKKKRTDETATLSMTGRDIQQEDLVISFNKADHIWEVQGTAEEIAERKEREDYETNVYVQAIKELVKRNPIGGWSGSAQDLMKAVFDITGKQTADSSSAVGKAISKYEYRLYCDGIEHKASKSNTRAHTFKKKQQFVPVYQKTIYDGNEG